MLKFQAADFDHTVIFAHSTQTHEEEGLESKGLKVTVTALPAATHVKLL